MTHPEHLPMRAAERLGRLFHWANQLDLTRQERAVLMHLIDVGNDHLDSIWSHAETAKKIDYSERVVRAALASLQGKEVISRHMRKHRDGTRSSDRIRVMAPLSLLRQRVSERELGLADHDGDLPGNRLEYGPADIAAPMDSGAAVFAEEPSYTSSSKGSKGSARQILPVGRSPRPRHGQPHRLATALLIHGPDQALRDELA